MIIIDDNKLDEFTSELADKIFARIQDNKSKMQEDENDWINEEEAKKIFPLRSKTSWQKMRDRGYIRFTQIGRKILYSRKSILDYLEKHKVGL